MGRLRRRAGGDLILIYYPPFFGQNNCQIGGSADSPACGTSACDRFVKRLHCTAYGESAPSLAKHRLCSDRTPMPPRKSTALPAADPANPFIVQSDRSVLVEVDNPKYAAARDALAPFAELEKSPEHIHTYRLTDLSLWNAAAAGMIAEAMVDVLRRYSKFPLPPNLAADITEVVGRYGRVRLERAGENLRLICQDRPLLEELARQPKVRQYLGERLDPQSYHIEAAHRGVLKQALIAVGYPAEDLAGYTEGASLPLRLRAIARSGMPFHVRDYQRAAAEIFHAGGDVRGGSGVIVLPCGAAKTIVGIAAMALLQRSTLVLNSSIAAVKQ